MALYVLKFGGTSVADLARLEHVAKTVQKEVLNGNQVVVVVSAMAGITDQLIGYSKALSPHYQTTEHDVVATAGEQVTAGLAALSLKKIGVKAQSFLAWQLPIHTDSVAGNAKIQRINPEKLLQALKQGIVPIVAGFQGLNAEGKLTTLGRGGSDTTAVALAVALKADRCDIYTDVDGVYTADPRLVPAARRQKILSYSEMFEMSSSGAKVLQTQSVELAMQHKIHLRVLSGIEDTSEGTEIIADEKVNNKNYVTGIAHSLNEAKIVLKSMPNDMGATAKFYSLLNQNNISIDMVTQSHMRDECFDIEGMIKRTDIERFQEMMRGQKSILNFNDLIVDKNVAKITVVGIGLRSNLEIPTIVCKTLADAQINTHMIYSSEIKMSVVINQQALQNAITLLHKVFGLDQFSTKEAA